MDSMDRMDGMDKVVPGVTPWFRQRTTWVAIGGIVGAVGAYLCGEATGPQMAAAVWAAAMVIFQRFATAKLEAKVGK